MEAKPILSIRNLIEATIDREPKPRSRHLKHNIPNVVRQWNALTCVRRQPSRNSSPMESEITKEEEDDNMQQHEIEEEDDLSDVGEGCSSVISEVVSSVNNNNTNNNGGGDDDNKVKNNTNHFIMKRFLPAAQAMATPSPPTSQRPPIPKPNRRRSAPLLQRKVSRTRLPRQSRPILFRKGFDEQEEEEEEEEESNRLFNFKMACVGLFSHRLKNVLGNSPKGSCWSSRNNTKSPRSSFRETEEEEDTSSGAEDERVVIAATKRRALEVRARKAYSSQNAASQSSMSTPSPSPMRWNKEFSSAEIGQVLLNKIRQHNSAFSGSAFSPQPQPHPRIWVEEENKDIQKMNMNDKSEEEEEEEVWYSGNSSPLVEEEQEEEGSEFGERDSSPVSVLLLQPPLPKSPTESWLWRSLPSLNTPSPYQPIVPQHKAYHGNIHKR